MKLFGNKRQPEYINRIVDVHSHIIPGVDDGSRSMEQSKAMLDIAWEQGIHTIIATPHHMPDAKNASPQVIEQKVAELQEYADEKHYDMTILTGNEIYYYGEVIDKLEEEKVCTMAESAYVLVEFSPMDDARYIRNSLSELQNMGYDPIVAHVERYMSLLKAPFDKIKELRDMGILIQVNAASVTGGFGKPTKTVVEKLLKKKYDADYVEDLLYRNAEKYLL